MNIAEILKYCPKYTKLYSPTWGNVKLIEVTSTKVIKIKVCNYTEELTSEGCYSVKGECILFPSKDQRDWSKFRLPVKRGDIMMDKDGKCPFIANGDAIDTLPKFICGITFSGSLKFDNNCYWIDTFYIPASEEAKKELFDKMAEAGYKWNADTLELEKLEPKFKEGDVIIDSQGNLCLVSKIKNNNNVIVSAVLYQKDSLMTYNNNTVERDSWKSTLASIENRNKLFSALVREGYKYDKEQHKLVKQKFKPFDKVLVRNLDTDEWLAGFFEKFDKSWNNPYHIMNLYHRTDFAFKQCIPYEGNEYLLGTTNDIKN